MPKFGDTSNKRLIGVHPDLVKLMQEVVKKFDISVLKDGGFRTYERQAELVKSGASKRKYSKHCVGMAIDVAPYPTDWNNRDDFHLLGGYVLGVAHSMGMNIRWGGDWNQNFKTADNNFDDLVHFELA